MLAYAKFVIPIALIGLLPAAAVADTFFFNTGDPDGRMATASRPDSAGKFEIELADDFALTKTTSITSATFTGLLTGNEFVGEVRVEIYRVFPKDLVVGRTSGPPTFSTPQVPTRVNSPSDGELTDRDTADSNLTFTTTDLGTFSASNSVRPNGVRLKSGGDGAIRGEEVQFDVNFTKPLDLPDGHYFFVPQVEMTDPNGNFFWLSAARPIAAPGTPFPPGFTDLQSWTRNAMLDPDWLRVGTDIVGGTPAPTFNAAFSLKGNTVPEPSIWAMILLGFAGVGFVGYRKSRNGPAGLSAT